jgi:hypothetical protein
VSLFGGPKNQENKNQKQEQKQKPELSQKARRKLQEKGELASATLLICKCVRVVFNNASSAKLV